MSRNVRIVTTSLATLESVHPPFNLKSPTREENVERAKNLLEAAAAYRPDLVILPETFALAGMGAEEIPEVAEPAAGPIHETLAALARKGHMNVIAGHLVRNGSAIFNRALAFDRSGALVASYDKMHPVGGERAAGVTPGKRVGLASLDFGKVGMAICFDINWPAIWREFSEQGVDLVAWISAYDGGFPLRAYAWKYQYPIITAVMSYHARLCDIAGEEEILTSRWQRLGFVELSLDRALFHTDNQMDKIIEIQKTYGDRIRLKTHTEEHLFTIETAAPELTIGEIVKKFGLETFGDYIRRCSE